MRTVLFKKMTKSDQADELIIPKGWESIQEWEKDFGESPIGFWHEASKPEDGDIIIMDINPESNRMALEEIYPITSYFAGQTFKEIVGQAYIDPFDPTQAYMPEDTYQKVMC